MIYASWILTLNVGVESFCVGLLSVMGRNLFKQVIIRQVHVIRNDQWANHVKIRIQGAVSDLHAADARYHEDCKSSFMAPCSIKAPASGNTSQRRQGMQYSNIMYHIYLRSHHEYGIQYIDVCDEYLSHDGVLLTGRILTQIIFFYRAITNLTFEQQQFS